MKDEIKEILDYVFSLAIGEAFTDEYEDIQKARDYITNLQEKVDQYENPDDMTLMFMWCDEKAKDKIKQLQEENERLSVELNKNMIERNNYLSKNEKAINEVIRVLQIILEQPSEDKLDDLWIINKLEGIQTLLQGEDKE